MSEPGSATTTSTTATTMCKITSPQPLILGLWQRGNDRIEFDACCALHDARTDGYDYVTTIIPTIQDVVVVDDNNNTNANNNGQIIHNKQMRIRTDLTTLPSQWWKTSVVGIVSIPNRNNANTIATMGDHPIPMDTTETSTAVPATYEGKSIGERILLDETFEHHLRSSLEWSIHMNLPAIILPDILSSSSNAATTISSSDNYYDDNGMIQKYCTIIQRIIGDGGSNSRSVHNSNHQQIWIPVPLSPLGLQKWVHLTLSLCRSNNGLPIYALLMIPPNNNNSNSNRCMANYHINIILALHAFMGSGYPIAAVQVCTNDFLINKKGFPTLSKLHQTILTMLLKRVGRTIRTLVVHDTTTTNTTLNQPANTKTIPLLHYQQYLQHFRKTRHEIVSAIDTDYATNKEYDYLDQLQQPLQPLKDHLENNTYEVFEQDPIKYKQYQKAIQLYMEDFIFDTNNNPTRMKMNPNNSNNTNTITILVVGAGRGPLVSACCLAFRQVERIFRQQQQQVLLPKIVIYAVEKNPSAVLYLHSMLYQSKDNPQHVWYDFDITIIHEDLRHLSITKHTNNRIANVVVSELLGSFGCNELSPECLSDLLLNTSVCNKETISIPYKYTSYLAPVSSTKLYQQVCQQSLFPNTESTSYIGSRKAVETPYVVRPHAASQMHVEVPCWSFEHGYIHQHHHHSSSSTTATTMASASSTNTSGSNGRNHHHSNNITSPNHERSVQISFTDNDQSNPWYATSTGCGYNPPDIHIDTILHGLQQQQQNEGSTNSNSSSSTNNSNTRLPCWILNGLLGTFTAILYTSKTKSNNNNNNNNNETIQISTAPNNNFSIDMFSWFPLYFPFHEPILVPQYSTIQVTMERKCCKVTNRVWYEWSVQIVQQQQPQQSYGNSQVVDINHPNDYCASQIMYISPIHNPGGRSYHVAM